MCRESAFVAQQLNARQVAELTELVKRRGSGRTWIKRRIEKIASWRSRTLGCVSREEKPGVNWSRRGNIPTLPIVTAWQREPRTAIAPAAAMTRGRKLDGLHFRQHFLDDLSDHPRTSGGGASRSAHAPGHGGAHAGAGAGGRLRDPLSRRSSGWLCHCH